MSYKIACLILNYNDYNETINCVKNLLMIDKDGIFQIVIVDNNSKNDSVKKIEKAFIDNDNVELIQNDNNGGYARGNNFGFRYIDQKYPEILYTILMNPDTRLLNIETVYRMNEKKKKNENLAVIAPVVIYNGEIDYPNSAWNTPNLKQILKLHCRVLRYKSKQFVNKTSKGTVKVDAVQGGFFMAKMACMKKIDFFDERTFMYSEEVLLARDLAQVGFYEAVITDQFFAHNHKNQKKVLNLKKRLWTEKNAYHSRKVYCDKYLGKKASFLLEMVYIFNDMWIVFSHPFYLMKNKERN